MCLSCCLCDNKKHGIIAALWYTIFTQSRNMVAHTVVVVILLSAIYMCTVHISCILASKHVIVLHAIVDLDLMLDSCCAAPTAPRVAPMPGSLGAKDQQPAFMLRIRRAPNPAWMNS